MYSANLVNTLNKIALEYKGKITREITDVLNQPKYKNTGAGVDSLRVEVIEGTAYKSPEIIVSIADHINILAKRNLQWMKMPPINDLEEWAKTRELSGSIPGYKNGLAPNLPPWKATQRIVWAIAKSKQKFDVWKPKPWRKKSLGNVLKQMNALVLIEFEKAIDADFQNAVNDGLRNG